MERRFDVAKYCTQSFDICTSTSCLMCPMTSYILRRHYDNGTLIHTLNIHIRVYTQKKKESGLNVTSTNDMT